MTPQPTFTRRQLLASAVLILPPILTRAQGTPVATSREAIASAFILEQLTGKRVNVFLARHTLMPNAVAPTFERVGSALVMVEAGAITVTADGPILHRTSGETGPTSPIDVPDDGMLLHTGDGVLIGHGQRMSLANAGDSPASVLMLVAHVPYREFSYVHPTALPGATGIATTVIGYGAAAFPEAPAVMVVEQDAIRPRGSAYSSTFHGIEIGGVVSGSAHGTLRSGEGWITKWALDRSGPPILPGETEVAVGEGFYLAASDGYTSHDGSITWRAVGDGPLIVVRGQVIPVPQPANQA